MMSNFLTELRADAHLRELYRNPGRLNFLADGLPAFSGSSWWRNFLLLKLGNLLILTGTRLKNAAQPRPMLSQETL